MWRSQEQGGSWRRLHGEQPCAVQPCSAPELGEGAALNPALSSKQQ